MAMKCNYKVGAIGDNGELLTISELKEISDEDMQTYCENEKVQIPLADSGTITFTFSADPDILEELRIQIASWNVKLRNIVKLKKRKKQRLKGERYERADFNVKE